MNATRLDRLVVECDDDLELSDFGANLSPADIAGRLLERDRNINADDVKYCQQIEAGERDDDDHA
jgi:hypothetical protein